FLPAFLTAYPNSPPIVVGDQSQIIAVEKLQDNVIQAAMHQGLLGSWWVHNPAACSHVMSPRGATGLRLFNRSAVYNNEGFRFTTAGTANQLLAQVGPEALAFL